MRWCCSASEPGALLTKDRLLDEVWHGVPVTDEALTQCIKILRQKLGDDAARPRFIETVPKHGYRFIASVEREAAQTAAPGPLVAALPADRPWRDRRRRGRRAGRRADLRLRGRARKRWLSDRRRIDVHGADVPEHRGRADGRRGVSFGIAAAEVLSGAPVEMGGRRRRRWAGCCVGGFVKLLGLDAFNLLVGQSPGDITGAREGLLLGGAVGLGLWLGSRRKAPALRYSAISAGTVRNRRRSAHPLLGGRLLGGSLDLPRPSIPGFPPAARPGRLAVR